jgi:competence protein ComEC
LLPVLAVFATGIAIDRFLAPAALLSWTLAGLTLWLWWRSSRKNHLSSAFVFLLVAITALGAAWHHQRWNDFSPNDLSRFAGERRAPVALEAIALESPRTVPAPTPNPLRTQSVGKRTRLRIRAVALRDGSEWVPAAGRTTLWVDGDLLGIQAGDRLRAFGQLARINPPLNPGTFDFAAYARADRELTRFWLEHPDGVTVIQPGPRWSLARGLDALRRQGDRLLWQNLSHQRSGLAAATLLGLREQLDPDQTDEFMQTGTIHLLVISGSHVAILAACWWWAMRGGWIPRGLALATIAGLVVLYTLITDMQPPVVRAAVAVLVGCLAIGVKRTVEPLNALAAAALVVLVLNPCDLFRAGAQLSFLCVATLIVVGPRLRLFQPRDALEQLIHRYQSPAERALHWSGSIVMRLLLLSLAIWIVTAPLCMERFHLISPVAIPLNVVLWVPMSLALIAGFATIVLGAIWPPLGLFCGWFCDRSLGLVESIVALADRIPGSHAWVAGPPLWWVIGWYFLLAALVFLLDARRSLRPALLALGAWCVVWLAVANWPRPAELRCTFLSVGHGCATVLELPDGRVALYDAGQLGSPEMAARTVAGYLWSRGRTHIDWLIVSHADVDHFNGVPDLLRQFSLGQILVGPRMWLDQSLAVVTLRRAVDTARVPLVTLTSDTPLELDPSVTVTVLHPPPAGVPGNDNAQSLVLALEYQGQRLLLTGDLEQAGIQRVTNQTPWDTDILLAPHHGSLRSDPARISAWCQPELVVISSGPVDPDPVTERGYAGPGRQVLATPTHGAITFLIRDGELSIATFR